MNRRQFATRSAIALPAIVLTTAAPGCPGPSKEKAVRVAGFVIDLSKEALPLMELLGGKDIAQTMREKVIPALEKMKSALESTDIPASESALETARNVLKGVETGLLNLPDSARRTTIIGILASARMLLLTVEAFIDSEMPAPAIAKSGAMRTASAKRSNAQAIREAFEVVRQ